MRGSILNVKTERQCVLLPLCWSCTKGWDIQKRGGNRKMNIDLEREDLGISAHVYWRLKKIRSIHQRCSIIKGILINFANITGKHLFQSLFFNQNAGLKPAILLKRRACHICFPVSFTKFLRTPFLRNTSGRLLLENIMQNLSAFLLLLFLLLLSLLLLLLLLLLL